MTVIQNMAGQMMLALGRIRSDCPEFTDRVAEDCDALHSAVNDILEAAGAPYRLIRVSSVTTGHVRERS